MILIKYARADTLEPEALLVGTGTSMTIYRSRYGWAVGFWDHKDMEFMNAVVCGDKKSMAEEAFDAICEAIEYGELSVDLGPFQDPYFLEDQQRDIEDDE